MRINVDFREYMALAFGTNTVLTVDDIEIIVQFFDADLDRNAEINLTANDFFNVSEVEGKSSWLWLAKTKWFFIYWESIQKFTFNHAFES